MLHTKFREHRPARRFLSVFTICMGLAPSWSCDPDFAIKLLFTLPMDAPRKISL